MYSLGKESVLRLAVLLVAEVTNEVISDCGLGAEVSWLVM
jgi:hypothetical protein